jgi:undecaprenyl-diphosphatase
LSIINAIILGIVQGLSEFLPISSTAHLTLAGKIMGVIDTAHTERWTAFIAVIQLGTLCAVLVYFFKDIVEIIRAFFQENLVQRKAIKEQSLNSRMGWMIGLGTIPIVVIGLSLKHVIEGALTKNLVVISFSLILLAVILAVAERVATFKKDLEHISIIDAIFIGCAQCFALIPGASRSGTTITGGLFLGLKRETAARFSFLLSIPAVFASGLLELKESLHYMDHTLMVAMIVATVVAGISGYLAIDFLLKYLKKNTTSIFIYYRIILGLVILILLKANLITSAL